MEKEQSKMYVDLNRMVRNNKSGDMGALKLTTQKFYRINGGSTQLEGVKSDVVVPDRYSYIDVGEKDQKIRCHGIKLKLLDFNFGIVILIMIQPLVRVKKE